MSSSAPKPPRLKPPGSRDNAGSARSIAGLRTRPRFVRVTGAGVQESQVHDVGITRKTPNYPVRGRPPPGAAGGSQPCQP